MPARNGTKTAALVALLIANLVLVYAIVRNVTGGDSESAAQTPTPGTTTGVTTATTSPTATPTSTPTSAAAVAASMPLSIVDDNVAWRAIPGDCATGGAQVAVTTNGGTTWTPAASKMRAVTRVSASSATTGFVVGALAAGCQISVQNSEDAGKTWMGGATGSTWRIDLKDRTSVFTAGGSTVTPCETGTVTSLERTTDAAVTVLCSTGDIRATTDVGQTWATTGNVPGAVALGAAGPVGQQRLVVAAKSAACPGLTVATRQGGARTFSPGACVDVGTLPAGTPIGVGMGTGDTAKAWLVVGTKSWRSSADLRTWQNVS